MTIYGNTAVQLYQVSLSKYMHDKKSSTQGAEAKVQVRYMIVSLVELGQSDLIGQMPKTAENLVDPPTGSPVLYLLLLTGHEPALGQREATTS